ncbi:MAG: MlaD family protein [Nocardioides sp.]|nr:MlaD family protein [Nocardioides sp.]
MTGGRDRSDAQVLRLGAVTLAVMLVVLVATFNLSQFPGFGGETHRAELSDASGLRVGNMVQVAGIRSGRVQDLEVQGDRVVATFEVDHGIEVGDRSRAAVKVLNLLGEKYLELTPEGDQQLASDEVIPLERTESAYDIVGVLGDLTETTEGIDTDQLTEALDVVGQTLTGSSGEIRGSFDGIARLSRTVSSRDEELQELLRRADSVTELLADRSTELARLMRSGDLVFSELQARREAISRLLVHARRLAVHLEGLAADNRDQIGPALSEVRTLLGTLQDKRKELKETVARLGPYADILGNIVGTGPWFDGYVVNLLGFSTGEFVPSSGGDF